METRPSKTDKIFLLVKDDEEKIRIAVGKNVVSSKKFDNYEQAENYIGTKPYELIFNTCFCITQNLLNNEKTTKKTKRTTKKDK